LGEKLDYFVLGHLDAKKDLNLRNYFIEPSQYQQKFENYIYKIKESNDSVKFPVLQYNKLIANKS